MSATHCACSSVRRPAAPPGFAAARLNRVCRRHKLRECSDVLPAAQIVLVCEHLISSLIQTTHTPFEHLRTA